MHTRLEHPAIHTAASKVAVARSPTSCNTTDATRCVQLANDLSVCCASFICRSWLMPLVAGCCRWDPISGPPSSPSPTCCRQAAVCKPSQHGPVFCIQHSTAHSAPAAACCYAKSACHERMPRARFQVCSTHDETELHAGGGGQPRGGNVGPQRHGLRDGPHHGGAQPHLRRHAHADAHGRLPPVVRPWLRTLSDSPDACKQQSRSACADKRQASCSSMCRVVCRS